VTNRYGATTDDYAGALDDWGEPRYRARQLWDGLYTQRAPLDRITAIPKALRARIADAFPYAFSVIAERRSTDPRDPTTKWLFESASPRAQVETVLMESTRSASTGATPRATVCVSSQAGCAMACSFCATGQAGFERHLDSGEIVEQVLRAQHATEQRVGNVVFMGMGEPLANLGAVLPAIERLHGDLGISARHITVSTVGVVPGMEQLAEFPLPVTLAVSLHAADDDRRNELVPLNRRYPIEAVIDAARAYAERKGRRVTFEYAGIAGVNVHPHQARALADRLRRFPAGAHVNLIPLNPTSGYGVPAASHPALREFAAILEERGVRATVRRTRGQAIDAACGQLRQHELAKPELAKPKLAKPKLAKPKITKEEHPR
jgi:23S rRNA (adenine2503-C2)-methyltransferase